MMEAEFEHVLKVVLRAESLGSRTLADGVKLVGHVPHVAPQAHLHIVFTPLDPAGIKTIEDGIGRRLPVSLKAFFRLTNGIDLFSSSLSIHGFRRNFSRSIDQAWQPFDIVTPNLFERPSELNPALIWFGSYDWDGSYLAISNDSPDVFRCDRRSGTPLNRWSSLGVHLTSEVDRLAALYDEMGRLRDSDRSTLPPKDN